MKIVGIILEANPLHNGHQYLINEVKTKENPDLLIAITSTYFSMRGDVNCYPKCDKVNYLLNAGFNLVFELPTILSMQRSDIFAKNAIEILSNLNITHLAFSMESNSEIVIKKATDAYTSLQYEQAFKNELKNNESYKKAQVAALKPFFSAHEWNDVCNSNFLLGLEYLKIIKATNIEPIIIKRIGPKYTDLISENNIASATYIRELIKNNNKVSEYLPNKPSHLIDLKTAEQNILKYWNYLILIKPELIKKNSINSYIVNNTKMNLTYDEFIDSLTTNKITKTRIKRIILGNLLNFNSDDNFMEPKGLPYLRLLGLDKKGTEYLNMLPKNTKKAIFSNPNEIKNTKNYIINSELITAKFYDLIANEEFYISEYKFPIRKD